MKTFIKKLMKIGVFCIIGITLCKIFGFGIGKLIATSINLLLLWFVVIQKESDKRLFFTELLLCNSTVVLFLSYYGLTESFWLGLLYTILTWGILLLILWSIGIILRSLNNHMKRKIKEKELEVFKKKLGI